MKKTLITTAIVVVLTFLALYVFTRVTQSEKATARFAEVQEGKFEITVSTTGELLALNSIDIMGPDFTTGRDVRSTNIRITDLVPEGTVVKAGDYVARLDRTELENTLKDERERLNGFKNDLEVLKLDTAVQLTNMRDQITNQIHTVEEREITLRNSKYEPPTTIRQAEINVEQSKRQLDQLMRSYQLRVALSRRNVNNRTLFVNRTERRINDYEEVLQGFTITAPSPGMIIYKKDRLGAKRKTGSSINPMDRIIATLPDLSVMLSKIYVSEIEISKVKVGQEVHMSIDAFPANSYTGNVISIANIGETLPNSDSKVFEVQIKIDGNDMNLRPSMTTNNKIIINSYDNVMFINAECVRTGSDNLPVVYTKSGTRQIVVLGEANEKDIIVLQGLEPGDQIYTSLPLNREKFRLAGEELIPVIKEREEKIAKN
jgi:multidrug efflux pump subunit AcrA (membrane-fusion protein)